MPDPGHPGLPRSLNQKLRPSISNDFDSLEEALTAFWKELGDIAIPQDLTLGNHEERVKKLESGTAELEGILWGRLMDTLPKSITMKEGVLDTEAFKTVLTESVKAETEYIAKLTEAGKVRGFGGKPADPNAKGVLKESFKDTFLAMGMTKEEAEKKATIAAEGR